MKVRITKRDGYGDRWGVMHACGEVVDFPEGTALSIIEHNIAVPVREEETKRPTARPERTVRKPAERTVRHGPKSS